MHAAAIVSNLRKCDEPAVKAATARAVHGALMPQRDAEPLAVQQRPPSQPLADDKGGGHSLRRMRRDSAEARAGGRGEGRGGGAPAAAAQAEALEEEMAEWEAKAAAEQARAARLAQHQSEAIIRTITSSYSAIRSFSQTKLDPRELSRHGASIVQNLEDPMWWVKKEAVFILGKLEPRFLAPHADTLIADLQHTEPDCRRASAEVIAKLEPQVLSPHGRTLAGALRSLGANLELATRKSSLMPASLPDISALRSHHPVH